MGYFIGFPCAGVNPAMTISFLAEQFIDMLIFWYKIIKKFGKTDALLDLFNIHWL